MFLIYSFSRSGSTLLCSLLNKHPRLECLQESWLFPLLARMGWKRLSASKQHYLLCQLRKNGQSVPADYYIYSEKTPQEFWSCLYPSSVGEKNPVNVLYANYLGRQYPEAKRIFLKRHPLGIANSYLQRWHKTYSDDYLIKVVSVIKVYAAYYQRALAKGDCHEVSYESLLQHPQKEWSSILAYLGVERAVLNESILEKDKARRYAQDLSLLQQAELSYLLLEEIQLLGYESVMAEVDIKRLRRLERRINWRSSSLAVFCRRFFGMLRTYLSYYRFCWKRKW